MLQPPHPTAARLLREAVQVDAAGLSLFPGHSLKGVFLGCREGPGELRKPGKSQGKQQDSGTCVGFGTDKSPPWGSGQSQGWQTSPETGG